MRVFAYCIAPAVRAVRAATGTAPLTSPPWTADLLRPEMLAGWDLIYLRLYGLPDAADTWFGGRAGELVPALCKYHLDALEPDGLGGAGVVVANCYGASSPLIAELYQAGAGAVIAGHGPNWGAADRLVGTDLLVHSIILGMRAGMGIKRALQMAKVRLAFSAWRAADRDAMQFSLIERKGGIT